MFDFGGESFEDTWFWPTGKVFPALLFTKQRAKLTRSGGKGTRTRLNVESARNPRGTVPNNSFATQDSAEPALPRLLSSFVDFIGFDTITDTMKAVLAQGKPTFVIMWFVKLPKPQNTMVLAACLAWLLAFGSVLCATSSWSSGFSSGNFRVQSAAGAFGAGELWTFGGRGVLGFFPRWCDLLPLKKLQGPGFPAYFIIKWLITSGRLRQFGKLPGLRLHWSDLGLQCQQRHLAKRFHQWRPHGALRGICRVHRNEDLDLWRKRAKLCGRPSAAKESQNVFRFSYVFMFNKTNFFDSLAVRISSFMILPPRPGQRSPPQALSQPPDVLMQGWWMVLGSCGFLVAITPASHRCHRWLPFSRFPIHSHHMKESAERILKGIESGFAGSGLAVYVDAHLPTADLVSPCPGVTFPVLATTNSSPCSTVGTTHKQNLAYYLYICLQNPYSFWSKTHHKKLRRSQFDTWIYDIAANTWSGAADGPQPLMHHSAVSWLSRTWMICCFEPAWLLLWVLVSFGGSLPRSNHVLSIFLGAKASRVQGLRASREQDLAFCNFSGKVGRCKSGHFKIFKDGEKENMFQLLPCPEESHSAYFGWWIWWAWLLEPEQKRARVVRFANLAPSIGPLLRVECLQIVVAGTLWKSCSERQEKKLKIGLENGTLACLFAIWVVAWTFDFESCSWWFRAEFSCSAPQTQSGYARLTSCVWPFCHHQPVFKCE